MEGWRDGRDRGGDWGLGGCKFLIAMTRGFLSFVAQHVGMYHKGAWGGF